MTIKCSTPIVVNEGKNVICECECVGGDPPANCSWYKNGAKLRKTGKVKSTLNYSVAREDSGNYSCVGQSHAIARDEKSVKVTVHCKYL